MGIPKHIRDIIDKPSILPKVEKEINQTIKAGEQFREDSKDILDRMLL